MNYPDPNYQQPQGGYQQAPTGEALPEAAFVLNLKPHGGYDAPMLTIRGDEAGAFFDRVDSLAALDAGARIGNAHSALVASFNAAVGLGATPIQSAPQAQQDYQQQGGYQQPQQQAPQGGYQQPQQGYQQQGGYAPQAAPQGAQEQPPGPAPTCPHGVKIFKPGGVSKTNKPYGATWNCPLKVQNYRDPNGCPTQWINSR